MKPYTPETLAEPLLHFSSRPLERLYSVKQFDGPESKPRGLWFSVGDGEDGWREWCQTVGYGLLSFSYVTSLQPRPGARLLLLNSASDIDKFHQKYRQSLRASKFPPGYIGWKRVAENYDGIIIAPYCWERRHHKHARWYYTWDVASGCVWNADAMRIVECSPYQLPARAA